MILTVMSEMEMAQMTVKMERSIRRNRRKVEASSPVCQRLAQVKSKRRTDVLDQLLLFEMDDRAEPGEKAVRDRWRWGFIVRIVQRACNFGLLILDLSCQRDPKSRVTSFLTLGA
jgi:hypothetical protein